MPTYEAVSPDGRKFRLDGDSPPSEADLDEVFKAKPDPTEAASALNIASYARPITDYVKEPPPAPEPKPVSYEAMAAQGNVLPLSKLTEPLAKIVPKATPETMQKILTLPAQLASDYIEGQPDTKPTPVAEKIMASAPSEKAVAISTGVEHSVSDLANFFTSPVGIATFGMGALPKTAQSAVSLAFAVQMGKEVPEMARQLGEELGKPEDERDYQKISNLTASAIAQTGFAALGGTHAAHPLIEKTGALPLAKGELRNEVPRDASTPVDEQASARSKPVVPPSEPVATEANKGATAAIAPEIKTEAGGDINAGALGEVGMGGAKPGELESGGDSSVTGLAERVRALREKSGHTEPTEPGEGIAPEASVERGRQLLPVSDPEKIMSEFEKSGRFSSDDVAVVRAKAEELARATNKTEERFGTDSNEFRQAFKTESDWAARTKKMQTEWAKSGHAQQGEVDIDTGTFTGLARAFRDETGGKEFTPKQAKQAKGKAGKVKRATDLAEVARTQLYDHLDREAGGTTAEKKALDAANKTVREAAVRVADAETKSRVAKTVNDLNTARIQEEAVRKALEAAQKVARESATRLADAENTARVREAQRPENVQEAATKKALDAANKTVRDAAARLADAANKKRVAKADAEKKASEAQELSAKKALDAAQKKARDAAVAAAKAESKARVARADTPSYVWSRAREYIDQGIDDFDEIRNKIATDLGVPVNKVTEALSKSKRAKFLADELWRKQQLARDLKGQAKRWLTAQSTPGYLRFLEGIPKTLFSLKVGFHGTVALGTHAPMVAFQPRFWKTYVTDFAKMYRMVGSKTYYERQVQDLVRRPNYVRAQRAGLVNDPFLHEDFNSPETSKYFGAMTGMGNRGYSVLKILRQDMFDQMWNKLPKTAQIDEVAKALADGLNHSTGVVKGSAPTGANLALFAPRLEASRVAWLAVDPAKAAKTFLNWKNADAGDKVFAINQLKEKAWVAGTMLGMLAINQGILSAIGSNQKVNLTDPLKSDFLKFKIAGMSFSYGNAMISMARLPVRLYQIREGGNGRLKGLVHPDENSYTVLGEYARSQLSPFASLVSSLWFKSDWQNRPLPNSNQPVPSRLKDLGFKPYTWKEFLTEQVLPIPAEEAVREVWHDGMGMSPEQVKSMGKAMATIAVMGATGGRLVDDMQPHTIHGLLAEYQKASGGTPDYTTLRAALDKDDMKGARAAYDDLLKTKKKPSHIDEVMKPYTASEKDYWIKHFKPLTGSQKTERAFLATLDDDGKIAYEKARVERMAQYQKFKEMLKQK